MIVLGVADSAAQTAADRQHADFPGVQAFAMWSSNSWLVLLPKFIAGNLIFYAC
jgi:hypothetical protein